ncbi:uncharacterized mitochondrial protein-like protein [Tanacetum coccineum]
MFSCIVPNKRVGYSMKQPPGFEDPQFPDRVYKVEKAMYGLHQAPRAWYGTLSKYLLENGFQREFETLMHDPLVWRLYDTCGVHHVSTGRGHEIFMLMEKDYPLTKGLTTLMISNKLQVDQYSEMANKTASPIRDDSHREAFPTATGLDAGQDRENIAKTSAMPHEASPNHQGLLLLVMVRAGGDGSREDLGVKKSTEKGSDNTDEVANVLSTMKAANVLSSGGATSTPAGVATVSGSFPTVSAIFTTASVTTPYTRRTRASRGIMIEPSHTTSVPTISTKGKGKEKMVESTSIKKKKIQEQLDAQVARELQEKFAQEEQVLREQGMKDAEIAKAQAKRELGMMIPKLDRGNELIAKYMSEYEQAEAGLSLEEKMELITELVKYQNNLAEIHKYQAQQSKPSTKKEKRNFYMAILKSHAGCKTKDLRGMSFEQIEEKFIPV